MVLARDRPCLLLGCFVLCAVQAAWSQLGVRLLDKDVIETHLKEFSRDNAKRESIIKEWFAQQGCKDSNLTEQSLERKLPPNVICVVPGDTGGTILVGAHTDHVASFGEGVVDNWTSAALLPSFVYSLGARPRHHTFVYVGFSAEEKGMLGSTYYAQHLTPEQRGNIAAMINMDSLGLGPTKVWASHADETLLADLRSVAATTHLPIEAVDVENVGTSDSESFVPYGIPRITLHSVTQATLRILHSPDDRLSSIRMNDYYDSYHLIAVYLAYLDEVLKPKPGAKPAQTGH
jgi:Peptidase family M28